MEKHVCFICEKNALFKIRNESIYYCKEHAVEFFSFDSLEEVSKLEIGSKQAEFLKEFLEK